MLLDKRSMFSFFMEDFLYLCTHVQTKTKIVDTTNMPLAFSQNLQKLKLKLLCSNQTNAFLLSILVKFWILSVKRGCETDR